MRCDGGGGFGLDDGGAPLAGRFEVQQSQWWVSCYLCSAGTSQ
jgi:hypothetical protein